MSIWDSPEMKVADNFIKFEAVDDTTTGVITAIKTETFVDRKTGETKTVPQIFLRGDDGEERTLTAGQIRLRLALAEQRPEVGDRITVTLTQIEKRGGGRELKHFDLKVVRGEKPPF